MSAESRYLHGFEVAERSGRTFAPVAEVVQGVTMADAYALQRKLVENRRRAGNLVVGFKGGLMSAKSLADRRVTEPLIAPLFRSGDLSSGARVDLCGYRRAAFEAKLGFVFRTSVNRQLDSVDALQSLVSAVQPVMDLPDIAYRDDKSYGAIDMVAAMISSARFVRGVPSSVDATDLNDLTVSVSRDSVALTVGKGRESLDDQWRSLLTLVNTTVRNGYAIDSGQVVITGKIGDKGDLRPGRYHIDYGPLGDIRFDVVACTATPLTSSSFATKPPTTYGEPKLPIRFWRIAGLRFSSVL